MNDFNNFIDRCRMALADGNLELCLEQLGEHLDDTPAVYDEFIQQRGRLKRVLRERGSGLLSIDEYRKEYNLISDWATGFLRKLQPEHISLLNRVHDRILILTYEQSPTDWPGLFNEAFFSHAQVAYYNQEIPLNYRTSDVVIFDDSGPNARPYMVQLAAEMPQAHFLYYGESNPFTESRKRNLQDAAIFDRCANANSKFTVHARLRELLEFRKIYGVP